MSTLFEKKLAEINQEHDKFTNQLASFLILSDFEIELRKKLIATCSDYYIDKISELGKSNTNLTIDNLIKKLDKVLSNG